MENPPLVSLSLTHVHYNPNDPVSHLCAFLALVPQALFLTYLVLVWSTREAEVMLMFGGQMGCEALNWILKRAIRENRPSLMHGKGYGMPSSHAQFVAFFSTYLTLFMLFRHDPRHPYPSSTHIPTPLWQRVALSILSIASALAVAQSRIYLTYHTPRQVYVGYGVGVACGVAFFVAIDLARRWGWIDWALDTSLARSLRLRDLVIHEDPTDAGWERWELNRQKRVALKNR